MTNTILLTVLIFHNFGLLTAAKIEHYPVCITRECQELGDMYFQQINKNGTPCSDFYDYVCHGWAKLHPRPAHAQLWRVQSLMKYNALGVLKQKLEEKTAPKDKNVEKAKALYKMCMSLPFMKKSKADVLRSIVTEIGNWPMMKSEKFDVRIDVPWYMVHNYYVKKTGESAIFDFDFRVDNERHNRIVPTLKKLYSPYGMIDRFEDWTETEKQNYIDFLTKIILSVAPCGVGHCAQNVIQAQLKNVMKFREDLRTLTKATQVAPQRSTLTQFRKSYLVQSKGHSTAKIDWPGTILALYGNFENHDDITGNTNIEVEKAYFINLANLLGKAQKNVILNHVHLYFMERHLILSPEMQDLLDHSVSSGDKPSGTIRYKKPRWQSCVESVNMPESLLSMYTEAAFPVRNQEQIKSLAEETKSLIQQEIEESTWLNKDMKEWSIDKIKSLKYSIGYPGWKNIEVKEQIRKNINDEYPQNPQAYYTRMQNHFFASASYMQLPIYSFNVPYVICYGATSTIFGHELYHALDIEGITVDKDGKSVHWPPHIQSKYDEKTTCFENLYSNFVTTECQRYKVNPVDRLYIPSTAKEDVADAMGLKLAFKGYKKMLKRQNGICPVLPNFGNAGCDKLFFIAYANKFCSDVSAPGEKHNLLYGSHSMPRVRVNAGLKNMKEFSATFGCKPGDPLHFKETCDFWK